MSTPKSAWPWVKALLHSVYDLPETEAVHVQFDRVLEGLYEKLPAVADHFERACADILAFTEFPREVCCEIWSNNPRSGSTGKHAAAPTSSASSCVIV